MNDINISTTTKMSMSRYFEYVKPDNKTISFDGRIKNQNNDFNKIDNLNIS